MLWIGSSRIRGRQFVKALWVPATLLGSVPVARAELIVAGSPPYDGATQTGYTALDPTTAAPPAVNNSGTAIGNTSQSDHGVSVGQLPVRWDASGTGGTALGTLGSSDGQTSSYAFAINDLGTAVGYATKYLANDSGERAVRWDLSGTTATELGHLGSNSSGFASAEAFAVNGLGTAVGNSDKFVGGNDVGFRAVRWDASGTAATELDALGTGSDGFTIASAQAISDTGIAAGYSLKYVNNVSVGERAVRWDASGTVATELGNLGTRSDGASGGRAVAVNNSGAVVGFSQKFSGNVDLGARAVRWAAGGTTATELGNLGTDATGATLSRANAINASGTAVGTATKFVSHASVGTRAVRWDGSGTVATELASLGTSVSGQTDAEAYDVNVAGTAVGYAQKYAGGSSPVGEHAVIWLPDATAVDLNDLGAVPVPIGGTWELSRATSMSQDGWVAGTGYFKASAADARYLRNWVAQVGLGGMWTDSFSGDLNGTWGRGPQWTTGTPAMSVGRAVFNAASTYTVTLDRDEHTGTVDVNAGRVSLNFGGHALTVDRGLGIAQGATFGGAGTLVANVSNSGTLSPGGSPGVLTVSGNYTQASTGHLRVEVGGTGTGYDRLSLTGSASLGGTLDLSTLSGFAPTVGDAFGIVTAGTRSGTFATVTGVQIPGPSLAFAVTYAPAGVTATVTLPGDANLDRVVGPGDFNVLATNFGKTGQTWTGGDFDGDGTVGPGDFNLLASNFGRSATSGPMAVTTADIDALNAFAATVVPEPASGVALVAGLWCASMRRRRRTGVPV